MLQKLSKRERVLLIIFFSLLMMTLFIYLWLLPYLDERQQLLAEREQLQKEWEQISPHIEKTEEIRNSISLLEEELDQMKQKIPPQQSSYMYWEAIMQKAKDTHIEVLSVQEGELSQNENSMTITLNIEGEFQATMNFIDHLQTLPYIYALKKGSISETNDGIYKTMLTIDIYFINTNL